MFDIVFDWGLSAQTESRLFWMVVGFWLGVVPMRLYKDADEMRWVLVGIMFTVLFMIQKVY